MKTEYVNKSYKLNMFLFRVFDLNKFLIEYVTLKIISIIV